MQCVAGVQKMQCASVRFSQARCRSCHSTNSTEEEQCQNNECKVYTISYKTLSNEET